MFHSQLSEPIAQTKYQSVPLELALWHCSALEMAASISVSEVKGEGAEDKLGHHQETECSVCGEYYLTIVVIIMALNCNRSDYE